MGIEGNKYNRLTVIEKTKDKTGNSYLWLCKCECGDFVKVKKWNFTSGNTKSCGCLKIESTITMSKGNIVHGMSRTRIYRVWEAMKRRCDNPVSERHSNYGGRGITYCDEWGEFEGFYKWALSNGYEERLTIDRIDNNGNYEPINCRWATWQEQSLNKTNSRKVTYKNKIITMAELSEATGKPYHLLYQRIVKLGWSVSEAVLK